MDGPGGVVLVGARVAEIGEHAVAGVLRDDSLVADDDATGGPVRAIVRAPIAIRYRIEEARSSRR